MTRSLSILLVAAAFSAHACSARSQTTKPIEPATALPVPTAPPEPLTSAEPGTPAQPASSVPADTSKLDAKAELRAAETKAWETAKPVFEKYCASCHTQAGAKASKKKLHHFDMSTYPFGGHHATTIAATIREVLGMSGKKPTMPSGKPGAVKGDELAAIKAWADAWQAAHDGGAHSDAGHHHH
jgi:mono/diheme cytochrome c family protein